MGYAAAVRLTGQEVQGVSRVGVTRFAWGVVGYNVLVILWGALVRATGSGAGCGNNWPLCNGQYIPVSPRVDTVIEFTHRMMTGGATFLILGLLVWTFRATVKGTAARGFAVASTVLLVNEAFLGALLVKLGYVTGNRSVGRVVLLSVHLSNTLLLLGALTMTAVLLGTGQRWREMGRERAGGAVGFGAAVLGLAATLVVGVSGSLAALGDTLFPSLTLKAAMAADFAASSPWLLRLRGLHPLSAVAAGAFVVCLVVRSGRGAGVRGARVVVALLGLQIVLGFADVLLLAPVWMQVVHLLGADLYWVALVTLTARMVWPVRSRPERLSRLPAR